MFKLACKKRWSLYRYLLSILILFMPVFQVHGYAKGGLAISGSFYRHHFRMIPGETFESPNVNIVVFNHYEKKIQVTFKNKLPVGVELPSLQNNVEIPPHGNLKIPVKLAVSDKVVPGSYQIGVSAEVVPDKSSGIALVSSAQLQSHLTVFGEVSEIKIFPVTENGKPFSSDINLYYVEGANLLPAGYALGEKLEERIIPGNYSAKILFGSQEVAKQDFQIKSGEKKELKLSVQTVFVDGFKINSKYLAGEKNIASAGLTFALKNIYEKRKDVRVVLKVYYGKSLEELKNSTGKNLLEEVEIIDLPVLEVGSQAGRGSYVPMEGWKNGIYRFQLEVYGKGPEARSEHLLGVGELLDIQVEKSNFILYVTLIFLAFLLSQIGWFVVSKKRLKRVKNTNEIVKTQKSGVEKNIEYNEDFKSDAPLQQDEAEKPVDEEEK